MDLQRLFGELKRRNVFKVATAYAIAGWLIIQVSDTVFPRLGLPEWTVTFIIILVLIGFPIAIILAWAFELTPDGIEKSEEVDINESVTAQTGKKLNKVIITILSVLVVFLLTERIFFAESTILERDNLDVLDASIAVLPFADLSPGGDQEYFSDGLSEELLNVLAKVPDMKVAGRTSSFKFKGQNENVSLIGEELKVRHVLEGSVRKAGNTLRITAQLTDVSNGYSLWSETYDREYTAENIFQIQDEISQMVLNELKVQLLSEQDDILVEKEELPTQDIEAYESYLKGIQLLRNRDPEEIELAIAEFEHAIQLDPTYAEAYARLAISYARLYEYGSIEIEKVRNLIRINADQALFLDNSLGEAYAGLGEYYKITYGYEKSRDAFKRAYELSPNNPEILIWLSTAAVNDEGENSSYSRELIMKAYEIDPLSPIVIDFVAGQYVSEGEYEKALEYFNKNIELNPGYTRARAGKIDLLAGEGFGKIDEATIEHHKLLKEYPNTLEYLSSIFLYTGFLGLNSISDHYFEIAKDLYPENGFISSIERSRNISEGNMEVLRQSIDDTILSEGEISELELSIEFRTLVYNESYQEALQLMEKWKPKYFTDTLSTVKNANEFLTTRLLFEQVGNTERAEYLASIPCSNSSSSLEYEGDTGIERSLKIVNNLDCWFLNREYDTFFSGIEELYFNRKSKILWFIYYWNISEDDPLFRKTVETIEHPLNVLERIEQDKAKMAANVLAYFKTTDDWQEEWEDN